jgi:TIR domain
MGDSGFVYDLAVSFAGEQRPYVDKFVTECKRRDLRVFYDLDKTVEFWGKSFIIEFRKVYGGSKPRYVVPFLSREYLAKPYPMDEFFVAIEQELQRGGGYVLPVVVGDVRIPPELLNPAIGFLRADQHTPEELAETMAAKVASTRALSLPGLRLPRIQPLSFDPASVLRTALNTVAGKFADAAPALTPFGYTCVVTPDPSGVDVEVGQNGKAVCGLSVWLGQAFAQEKLAMSFAWPTSNRTGMNGWATVEWDAADSTALLSFVDLGATGAPQSLSSEGFFGVLWGKIIDFIDHGSVPR